MAQCPTTVDVVQPISCSGADDGILSVVVPAGTDPSEVYWLQNNDTLFGAIQSGLGPGSYLVFVPGCPALGATLNEPFNFFISAAVSLLPTCDEPCSGEVTVTPNFGVEPITYTWSHDQVESGPVGTGVCEQVVLVSATDANGCTDQDIITVDIPEVEVLTFGTPPSCFGFADGEVAAVATGGLGGPFEFLWEDAGGNIVGATPEVAGLEAGGYLVTATDTGGCSAWAVVMLDAPAPVDVTMTATGVSCTGENDGSASAAFADAVEYAWSGPDGFSLAGPDQDSIVDLLPGVYTVLVTAADGCVGLGTVEVASPQPLEADPFLDLPSCPGLEDGVVGAVVSGGTAEYLVSWTLPDGGSATGAFLSGVGAGSYSFDVEDANGCTTSGTAELEDPQPVQVALDIEEPLCAAGPLSGGSAAAEPTGGLGPYTAVWIDVATTEVVAVGLNAGNLAPGLYGLGLMDLLGCTLDTVFSISAPDSLILVLEGTSPACDGGSDGVAMSTVSGGIPDYTFLWTGDVPPTLTPGLTGLGEGTYNLEVTDANGCTSSASVDLIAPEPLVLALTSDPVGCEGNDGSAAAVATGGTPDVTIGWTDAGSTSLGNGASLNGLAPGTYTATAVDANGCVAVSEVDVDALPPLALNLDFSPVDCSTGSVVVDASASGGADPVTLILLSDGGEVPVAPGLNLAPGTYTLTAQDDRGCTVDTSWVLHPPLQLTLTSLPFGCDGGGVVLAEAEGGNPETGLDFLTPVLGIPDEVDATSASWSVGAAGIYAVTVVDGTCSLTAEVEVEGVTLFDWDVAVVDFACADAPGGVSVQITGGLEPLDVVAESGDGTLGWSSLDTLGLPAGEYTLSITDAAGCARDTTVNVGEAAALMLQATASDISCFGANDGTIGLTATGGTAPLTLGAVGPAGPMPEPLVGLAPGTYVAGVIDARGCTADSTVVIAMPAPLSAEVSVQAESCSGTADGSATVTPGGGTGPWNVQWTEGPMAETWSALGAGVYGWTLTDAMGCDTSGTAEILTEGSLAAQAELLPTTCNEGEPFGAVVITIEGNAEGAAVLLGGLPADVTASTDSTETWTWNNLAAGSYGWTAFLGEGCEAAGQVQIELAEPLVFNAGVSPPLCGGGTGTVELQGGGGVEPLSSTWTGITSQGDTLFGTGPSADVAEGIYTWTLADAAGCSVDTTIVIEAVSVGLGVEQTLLQPSCGGAIAGEATLVPFGGVPPYAMVVQGAADTTFLPFLVPGLYPLTVVDSVGCTLADTIFILPASDFTLIADVTPAGCSESEDGSIVLTTQNGAGDVEFTFVGPFGAMSVGDTIGGVGAGIYEVTALDEAGCPSVLLVEVGAPPPVIVVLDSLDRPSCSGDADGLLAVSVSGGAGSGFEVNWTLDGVPFASGETLEGLQEGQYAVEAVDPSGCTGGIASIPLVAEGDVTLSIPGDTALCAGAPLTLEASATGATEAYWSVPGAGGGVGLTASTGALPEGTNHWVFTAIRLGCVREDSVMVIGFPQPIPDAGEDQLIASGATAPLGAGPENPDWTYAWSPAEFVVFPESATTSTDVLFATTAFLLEVTTTDGCTGADTVVVEVLETLDIPSGFTPNGDGMNDRWNLGGLERYPSAEITVFNRWGDVLFTQGALDGPWDGTLNGVAVPVGTYYYHIRVDEPALQTEWTGPITIMR